MSLPKMSEYDFFEGSIETYVYTFRYILVGLAMSWDIVSCGNFTMTGFELSAAAGWWTGQGHYPIQFLPLTPSKGGGRGKG